MKAVGRYRYGTEEVLELKDSEMPQIDDHQLLVHVYATTVNRTDIALLKGKPFVMRFFTGLWRPSVFGLGTDFAGVVDVVGPLVTYFQVGDRVFGFGDTGIASQAEFMAFSSNGPMGRIPDTVSFEQAAASLEGAHYAINFINKIDLKEGQRVLVNGASGAIGSAAVQLLKARGVHVTAVCGTESLSLVESLGADVVIDYTKEDFTHSDQRYHYVFDAVGKCTFFKCKHLLDPKGIYISSELGPMFQNLTLALLTPLFKGRKVIFPVPSDIKKSLAMVTQLLAERKYQPLIDRIYSLDDIAEAYAYVASGQKKGNVVIKTVWR